MDHQFEWDEDKRLSNIIKHDIDFARAVLVFSQPHVQVEGRSVGLEHRQVVVGMLDERCIAIVYTLRGDVIRLISVRKARRGERRQYQAFHAH